MSHLNIRRPLSTADPDKVNVVFLYGSTNCVPTTSVIHGYGPRNAPYSLDAVNVKVGDLTFSDFRERVSSPREVIEFVRLNPTNSSAMNDIDTIAVMEFLKNTLIACAFSTRAFFTNGFWLLGRASTSFKSCSKPVLSVCDPYMVEIISYLEVTSERSFSVHFSLTKLLHCWWYDWQWYTLVG